MILQGLHIPLKLQSFRNGSFQKITSWLYSLTLTSAFLFIFALNLSIVSQEPHAPTNTIIRVLHHPLSAENHKILASYFLDRHNVSNGVFELTLAETLSGIKNPDVLGATRSIEDTLKKIKELPLHQMQTLEYWHRVIQDHPEYRDAYIQLALTSFRMGNMKDAEIFIKQAYTLDPNHAPTERIMTALSSSRK